MRLFAVLRATATVSTYRKKKNRNEMKKGLPKVTLRDAQPVVHDPLEKGSHWCKVLESRRDRSKFLLHSVHCQDFQTRYINI